MRKEYRKTDCEGVVICLLRYSLPLPFLTLYYPVSALSSQLKLSTISETGIKGQRGGERELGRNRERAQHPSRTFESMFKKTHHTTPTLILSQLKPELAGLTDSYRPKFFKRNPCCLNALPRALSDISTFYYYCFYH